jgi:hypothetical protein
MHREMGRLDPYIPNGCKDNKGIQHAVQSLRVLGAGLVARIQLTNSVRGREGRRQGERMCRHRLFSALTLVNGDDGNMVVEKATRLHQQATAKTFEISAY